MGNIKEDIIKMIDGELSTKESSRVMEAINQSPELESFYEATKQSTASLQSYFSSEDISVANERLKKSIRKLTKTKESPSKKSDNEKSSSWIRPLFDNFFNP